MTRSAPLWALALSAAAACGEPKPRPDAASATPPRAAGVELTAASEAAAVPKACDLDFGQRARAPELASLGDGWLVGWLEDTGDGGVRPLLSTSARARACAPAIALAERGQGLSLAARGDVVVALWREAAAGDGVIRGGRVDLEAGAVARATLSGGAKVGPPTVVAHGDGFVASWVEGSRLRAVRLDLAGAVVGEATFWGGNRHLAGPINPVEGARAEPHYIRPSLRPRDGGLDVIWLGDRWISDDQLAWSHYRGRLTWGTRDAEPPPYDVALGRWGAFADVAQEMILEARHVPNSGSWELLVRAGTADPIPVTSEPEGPLGGRLVAAGGARWVVWRSPATGSLVQRRIGADGALSEPAFLPVKGALLEADLAVAARGDALWVALADASGGVRLQRWPAAGPAPNPERDLGAVVAAASGASPTYPAIASLSDGRGLMLWLDYWDNHVAGLWLNAAGAPEGPLVRFPSGARCGAPTVAAVDDAFVAAYHCCRDKTSCSDPAIQWVTAKWGDKRPTGEAIITDERHYSPHLVLARGGGGDEATLVMTEGLYPRHIVARSATAKDLAGLGRALGAAKDRRLVDGAIATGLIASARGPVLLGHRTGQPRGGATSALWRVTPEGTSEPNEVADGANPLWGAHRLVGLDDGCAVVALAPRLETTDVVLHRFDRAMRPIGTTVIARNSGLTWAYLAESGGELAAAWFDNATAGTWAVVVDAGGERVFGPRRLDDPAIRGGVAHPAVFRRAAGGWRWFWTDPQRLRTIVR
ncbi:MAG: hypothetical protein CSA66_01260 [Proteobacteria bacterium]|nr:MAG: hypothetical protein CSA66_01260 [Pseudomonadota bacterium]